MKKILLSFSLFIFVLISALNINANSVDSEFKNWTNIGGNSSNSKVTYANTIKSEEDIEKRIDISGGYREPIIVDDMIYSLNTSIPADLKAQGYKSALDGYDLNGNLIKRIPLVEGPGFFSRLTTDGENTVYVALSTRVQAIDIENDKTLWVSENSSKQVLTQLVYHDGFLYGGAVTKASASQVPSDGYYFAIDTSKDDPSQDNEVIDYAWTWKFEDKEGNGFYWDGAAIVKDAIVFAGDRGLVVSHHLKKAHVYDQVDLNNILDDANKVRSTLNYNAYKDELLVVTQNSKAMFKIKMNGNKFDHDNIKSNLAAADQMSGGPAISKKENGYIYAPSGGMYANSFSIYNAETLEQKFTTKTYGTQSYPLVNVAAVDGYEYTYFIDYKTGDLVIGKYNGEDEPTFTKLSVSQTGKSPTYNSGSAIVASDGTIVVTKHDGGAIFIIKPKSNNYNASEMDAIINDLTSVDDLDYSDKDQIKQVYHQYNLAKEADQEYTNEKIESLNTKVDEISAQKVSNAISELDNVLEKENPTVAELENAMSIYGKLYAGDKDKVAYEKYEKILNKQLHLLLVADIEALPVGDDIKLADYKEIFKVATDYEKSPQAVKDMLSQSVKDKLDAAYEIAKGHETKAKEDAQAIEDAIDALPVVANLKLEDKDAVDKVAKDLEEASLEVQELVSQSAKTKLVNLQNKIPAIVLDNAIAALPDVADATLNDKENITKVSDDYNAAPQAVKNAMTSTLKTKLTNLVNRMKVLQIEKDIEELPSVDKVTLKDKEKVSKVASDFAALTTALKNQVSASAKTKLSDLQNKIVAIETEMQTLALEIEEKITNLPEISEVTLEDKVTIVAVANEYNDALDDVKSFVAQEAKDKLQMVQYKISALELEVVINELPKVKDLVIADKDSLEQVVAMYQDSDDSIKELMNKDALEKLLSLSDKMNLLVKNKELEDAIKDLEDQIKDLSKPLYKATKKGNTTYHYKLNSSKKYDLYKKVEKTATKTTTTNYRTTGAKKVSSKDIITKKGSKTIQKAHYKYNTKAKLTSSKVYKKNSKNNYVLTYSNTRTYHKNLTTLKTNKANYKNLSNKYTSRKTTTYTAKGYKAKHINLKYKKGVKKARYEYKYNSKGQLKSDKNGKSYRYYTSYNNKGKAVKTTKRDYNSKGKLNSKTIKVKLRTSL